ncbi:MAG: HAMP domain-containing histidine kinase [Clostridia bacterium]|nr:HAMP domain-containing histidine kinase [Clostridia bacterium]
MAVKKSMTRRWMLYGFSVIAAVLLAVGCVLAVQVHMYYHRGVVSLLEERAALHRRSAVFETVSADTWEDTAFVFVGNFDSKEQMELQVLSETGAVLASSTGFMPLGADAAADFALAKAAGGTLTRDTRNGTGEHIMALTALETAADGTTIGALRYVVSMRLVDRQIRLLVMAIGGTVLLVLLFTALVSFYFIRSIVHPVEEIGRAARRIAKGEYAYRIQKYNNDELGELCDTINYMAGEIERAERLKNDFISSVSHELRTPLTAIRGWSETLRDMGGDDPALMAKGMEIISEETDRLGGMVEELLDFSRMQNGKLALHFETVDLVALLEETVFLFRDRADKKGVFLHLAGKGKLPTVSGDGDRLKQVFINILDNAIKYSDAGDTVRVDYATVGKKVQIVVGDTGKGIAAEDLPRVTQKFYRADMTRPGSGIGLAVADEIVRGHGGTMEIDSKLSVGTGIIITLPIRKD